MALRTALIDHLGPHPHSSHHAAHSQLPSRAPLSSHASQSVPLGSFLPLASNTSEVMFNMLTQRLHHSPFLRVPQGTYIQHPQPYVRNPVSQALIYVPIDEQQLHEFPLIPLQYESDPFEEAISASFCSENTLSSADGPYARVGDIPDERLADSVAFILNEFCKSNPPNPEFPDPHDPAALFFSPFRQKTFTLNYYCGRLLEYMCCSKSCFVVAILYIVRLAERYSIFELNHFNVHRLICTAVVLAAKFMDDVSYSNVHYAKVGGIQTSVEMNKLESFMLKALDYRLFVTKENYDEIEAHITLIAQQCT
jgi:hypothetical protein